MQSFYNTKSNNFLPLLGNFWSNISDEEKTILLGYWSGLIKSTDKLYQNLYRAFLSKGIEYCPSYFEYTDEYLEVIFSGVKQNTYLLNNRYTYVINNVVEVPKLVHKLQDLAFSGISDIIYEEGVHYDIQSGRYIQFKEGVLPRVDIAFSGTSISKSTLYAPTIIKLNPVLFNLFGGITNFKTSYLFDNSYSPSFITSGLTEKQYFEYDVPTSGIAFRFKAEDGYSLDSDNNYIWKPIISNGVSYAISVSGLNPEFTEDAYGNKLFRFDNTNNEFLELTPQHTFDDYTVVAIAKHTGGRSYILGGDVASHLPFAANTSNASTSFGYNYDLVTGQIINPAEPLAVSDDVFVSIAGRNNSEASGHFAFLNGTDLTYTASPTKSGLVNIRYIGQRAYTTPLANSKFGGDVYEIIAYDRILTSGELSNIERYASKKYNINLNYSFYDLSIKGLLDYYKELIHGICKYTSQAPTVSNIETLYSLAKGVPFALTSGIVTISGNSITLGKYNYLIPSGFTILPSDSDYVNKFDILLSGISIWDLINNSGLVRSIYSGVSDYFNKYVIDDNISGLNYNNNYLNKLMSVINPAGLQYSII